MQDDGTTSKRKEEIIAKNKDKTRKTSSNTSVTTNREATGQLDNQGMKELLKDDREIANNLIKLSAVDKYQHLDCFFREGI